MKLEQLCVSLELAKELKEAGYPQNTILIWDFNSASGQPKWEIIARNTRHIENSYAAPTSAEIGEVLPVELSIGRYEIEREKGHWELRYYKDADDDWWDFDWSDEEYTEAAAQAKMWLYLKKENLL